MVSENKKNLLGLLCDKKSMLYGYKFGDLIPIELYTITNEYIYWKIPLHSGTIKEIFFYFTHVNSSNKFLKLFTHIEILSHGASIFNKNWESLIYDNNYIYVDNKPVVYKLPIDFMFDGKNIFSNYSNVSIKINLNNLNNSNNLNYYQIKVFGLYQYEFIHLITENNIDFIHSNETVYLIK